MKAELIFHSSNLATRLNIFIQLIVFAIYCYLVWSYFLAPNWLHLIIVVAWTLSYIFILFRWQKKTKHPYLTLKQDSLTIYLSFDGIQPQEGMIPLPVSTVHHFTILISDIQSFEINKWSSYLYYKNSEGMNDGMTLELSRKSSQKLGEEFKNLGVAISDFTIKKNSEILR
ncbi:MAG: hypothetical protein ACOYL6_18810 [Bacteriovoracaceae bacterium]